VDDVKPDCPPKLLAEFVGTSALIFIAAIVAAILHAGLARLLSQKRPATSEPANIAQTPAE